MIATEYRDLLVKTLSKLDMTSVDEMSKLCLEAYHNEANIFTFGNGGSGATASHAAGDFLKGASYGLERRFRIICLNDNVPSLMAIANDIGWDDIFVEPLKNFLRPNDLVIAISGSGNSRNVIKAVEFVRSRGGKVVGMTGFSGGALRKLADVNVHSDAMDMEVAEDVHMAVFNMVKKICMRTLMGESPSMGAVYDGRTL
jgi:D-sedoheptulose 7-phosphate isomerase